MKNILKWKVCNEMLFEIFIQIFFFYQKFKMKIAFYSSKLPNNTEKCRQVKIEIK